MQKENNVTNKEKWEKILQACEAAKHRCLLTNPQSRFMNDKDREIFNDIYSKAIRGRDWSIYNEETVQVFKECLPDDNLLSSMAEAVLLEALDKWSQRNEIEKEKRNAVQEALIKMRAEMDLALQEQEKKLSAEKDEAVQKAVQEKVLELAAKGAAFNVAKKPDDVVCAIKVVERKVDNVNRNVNKSIRILRNREKQQVTNLAAADHDNEGEFKPDFTGKVDEELLKKAWENVHSDSMKGKRRSACFYIYKKNHPEATIKDKAFVSFYNAIMYQLGRETQPSQS